jgi:hypothetical protein
METELNESVRFNPFTLSKEDAAVGWGGTETCWLDRNIPVAMIAVAAKITTTISAKRKPFTLLLLIHQILER